jgi:hypothetical protein
VPSGDAEHGNVLSLETDALPVYALIRGSEEWRSVRIEGRMRFPDPGESYLGFIYRYVDDSRRIDFGSVYVKGNDGCAQANPHFDTNVGRALYPEMRVTLTGESEVRIGRWQSFALEVVGGVAHLYVGESSVPAMTVPFGAPSSGAFGFKPRNPGARVWIDDLRVVEIDGFSYAGPPRPPVAYRPEELVTEWSLLGPLSTMHADVEAGSVGPADDILDDGRRVRWRPAPVDPRGALVTARATEYRGSRRVAYFRAEIPSTRTGPAVLEFSTTDALAIWLNGSFLGFAAAQDRAWWDAAPGSEHDPVRAAVTLRRGSNELLVRVVGGTYASGGFFLRVRR